MAKTRNAGRLTRPTIQIGVSLLVLGLCLPACAKFPSLPGNIDLPRIDKASSTDDKKDSKLDPPAYTGPKKRLGIMDMEVKVTTTMGMETTPTGGMMQTNTVSIPPPSDFGTGLTEMLTTALVDSGRFVCLERKALMDIQNEQALSSSAAFDPASSASSGKLLGAQALIRGAVTEYSYSRSSTGGNASILKGVGLSSSKAKASVTLDIRIYDVATGVILDSVKAEGQASSSATGVDIDKPGWKMSASGFSKSPLGDATRQAITKCVESIIKRMETVPWEGRIAEMDEDNGNVSAIYINAGSRMGLKQGDKLLIMRPGRAITDPETRVVIGRTKDSQLGSCTISTITDSLSIADPVEGNGYKVGDIVRFPETK